MPLSLSKVVIHIVFSTKDREPFIDAQIKDHLHAYLASVVREHDCEAFRVNGMPDHVHLAVRLGRTVSQSELMEVLKRSSSKWMKTQGAKYQDFAWQRGYGCFSVSPKDLDSVIVYIDNQEEHHRVVTFQEEYRKFLERSGVEFDERYLWD